MIAAILGAISGLYDKYLLASPENGGVGLNRMTVQCWYNIYQAFMMGAMLLLLWYPLRKNTTPFRWSWYIVGVSLFLSAADAPVKPAAVDTAEEFNLSMLDEKMVEIFLEEAMDLLESAGESLEAWLAAPQSNVMSALLRDLHTLKGGARMAEIKPVGDLAHELESLYEGLLDGRYSHSSDLGDILLRGHDRLAVLLEQLQARQSMQQPNALIESMKAFRRGEITQFSEDADSLTLL